MFEKTAAALKDFRRTFAKRSVLIPIISAVTAMCITVCVTSLNTFIVYDGDQVSVHNSYARTTEQALHEMGIELGEHDVADMPEAPENGVAKINIMRGFDVSLTVDGATTTMRVGAKDTVAQVLERAGVTMGAQDILYPEAGRTVAQGMNIAIIRYVSYQTEQVVDVPFAKETRKTDNMDKGTTKVIQDGSNGQKKQIYQVIVQDGQVSRTLLREEVIKPATPQITQVGTRAVSNPGTLSVSRGGAPIRYKDAFAVTATAYTTENKRHKTTATGAVARVGLIAVDPKVIPLGSRLYITSADGKSWVYGTAVAADTGGKIKGNRIDLFFDTRRECINFGRRKAMVYILE